MPLRWNYKLSAGLVVKAIEFSVRLPGLLHFMDVIGALRYRDDGSSYARINDRYDYRTRFNISISEVATLIINNVTEREETTFECKLYTVSNSEWAYRIRVNLTGKNRLKMCTCQDLAIGYRLS